MGAACEDQQRWRVGKSVPLIQLECSLFATLGASFERILVLEADDTHRSPELKCPIWVVDSG